MKGVGTLASFSRAMMRSSSSLVRLVSSSLRASSFIRRRMVACGLCDISSSSCLRIAE
jgi:hypothetical protein